MILLEPTHYFHVYNRANGNERIFLSAANYRFFLARYKLFIAPFVETYCYCLMSNHFHFLARIKPENEIDPKAIEGLKTEKQKELLRLNPELFISKRFSNFFSSYTQAFNKQQNRMGSLFMKNFKRKHITDESYLKNLVRYIHRNPVDAGMCNRPEEWLYSSYASVVGQDSDFVKGDEVLSWFDDMHGFRSFHAQEAELMDFD